MFSHENISQSWNIVVMSKKKMLPFATWMSVEDIIMQNEISEIVGKDKYCMISLICGI